MSIEGEEGPSRTDDGFTTPPDAGQFGQQPSRLVWDIHPFFLKYRSMNNISPWTIRSSYVVFEQVVKHSASIKFRLATLPSSGQDGRPTGHSEGPAQTYIYDQLSLGSIRLLHLSSSNDQDSPRTTSFSLITHQFDRAPPYYAISYSWLQGRTWTSIVCDEQPLVVQRSVYNLLVRLRAKLGAVAVWIDALCIDQTNLRERGEQVLIMDQIYRSAVRVVVWLGEEGNSDDHDNHDDGNDDLDTAQMTRFFDQVERHINGSDDLPWQLDPAWNAFARLLDRPWFTRVWVLQEVVLAGSITVWCSGERWEWTRLVEIFNCVLALDRPDTSGAVARLRQNVFSVAERLPRGSGPEDMSLSPFAAAAALLAVLASARGLRASWSVDKVYALLPICADRLGVAADYEKPVSRIYRDVAEVLLRGGCVDVLRHAGETAWNGVAGLPSWVPDWSCYDRPTLLPRALELQGNDGDGRGNVSVTVCVRRLHLQVFRCGSIRRTGVPWPGNKSSKDEPNGLLDLWDVGQFAFHRLESWRSMLWPRKRYAHTGETMNAAFIRTIVADSVVRPATCADWDATQQAYRARLLLLLWRTKHLFYSERAHGLDDLGDLHQAVREVCYKRTFFLTRDRHIGLGPFFTLPGDMIVGTPGTNARFVVRRTLRGRYRLVGECYVHGLESDASNDGGLFDMVLE